VSIRRRTVGENCVDLNVAFVIPRGDQHADPAIHRTIRRIEERLGERNAGARGRIPDLRGQFRLTGFGAGRAGRRHRFLGPDVPSRPDLDEDGDPRLGEDLPSPAPALLGCLDPVEIRIRRGLVQIRIEGGRDDLDHRALDGTRLPERVRIGGFAGL
jgi:hypothetical protein